MTDQEMDARLRAAGERFRAAHADTPTTADVAATTTPVGRWRPRVLLAVAAAAIVLLVAGLVVGLRSSQHGVPPTADNAGLVDNVWLLTNDGKPSTTTLYVSRNGALVADDECELLTATATVGATRLTITEPMVRLKPCLDRGFEPAFNGIGERVLRGAASFHIDSRGMTIAHAGVGSLRFALAQTPIPAPSSDIPTLTGTDWVAPNGSVLHIDPVTGQLSGGWCGGRAEVKGYLVRFARCPLVGQGSFSARLTGTTLTLTNLSHARVRPRQDGAVFRWRPAEASIEPSSLGDRAWHLESVAGEPASSGSLQFTRDSAVIDDGCAVYRRAVNVGAGTFAISGRAPAHACSDQASTADSFLFNEPATWLVRDGKLIVYGGGSQAFAIVYTPAAPTRAGHTASVLRAHPWLAPTPDHAVVTFTRTGYAISHPCYYRTGSARFESTSIDFSDGRSVPHSCPFHSPQPTRAVDAVFSGRLRWSISSGALTLSGPTGTLLLRPAGIDRTSLTSSAWHLISTTSDGQTRAAVGDVVLTFPTRQSLTVQRCYRSGAPVTVQSGTLTVRFLRTTLARPCPSGPPGTQEQDQVIDSVLDGTVTWAIDGDRLTLSKGAGTLVLTRRR